ncbi:MAG: hypothetical protein HKN43_06380 [Rhodothermales bacterium]|nr:hypothetical protein [Rhodothermales bacterium]
MSFEKVRTFDAMDKTPDTEQPSSLSATAVALERKLAPVAASAQSALATMRGVAAVFSAAGLGLWLLAVVSWGLDAGWRLLFAALLFLILFSPGAVWILIAAGAGQISRLPSRLLTIVSDGHEHVQSGVADVVSNEQHGMIRRTFSALRSMVSARGALLESKVMVAESIALVRVFNPVTMIIAGVAFVAGILLVVVVLAAGIVLRFV